jgi:hypothetical protein
MSFPHQKRLRRRGAFGPSEYEQRTATKGTSALAKRPWCDMGDFVHSFLRRDELITQFGFAIPNEEAITALAHCPQPIVEVGAGLAYWAYLVKERYGVHVDCYDLDIPPTSAKHGTNGGERHGYHFDREPWHPVKGGTPESIGRKEYQTLLLIWPDYCSPMALQCLMKFTGSTVVYVGEGDGGCTGDNAFHEALEKEWTALGYIEHPQWSGLNDYMTIYRRLSADPTQPLPS